MHPAKAINSPRAFSPAATLGKRTSSLSIARENLRISQIQQEPSIKLPEPPVHNQPPLPGPTSDMEAALECLKRANQELRHRLDLKQMEAVILRQAVRDVEVKAGITPSSQIIGGPVELQVKEEKKLIHQGYVPGRRSSRSKPTKDSRHGITHTFEEDSLSEKAPAIPYTQKSVIFSEGQQERQIEPWSEDDDASSQEKVKQIAKLKSCLASQHHAMQLLLKLKEPILQQNAALFRESGDIYHGEVLAGKRHGKGENLYPGGDVYKGSFQMDLACGKGVYIWKGGRREYRGDFEKGKRHGFGVYSEHNQIIYRGEWAHGRRHGEGTANLADGSVYHGTFENNMQHGTGMKIDKMNGKIIIGRWEKGALESEYQIYQLIKDGTTHPPVPQAMQKPQPIQVQPPPTIPTQHPLVASALSSRSRLTEVKPLPRPIDYLEVMTPSTERQNRDRRATDSKYSGNRSKAGEGSITRDHRYNPLGRFPR